MTLDGISELIFLDRYAMKDPNKRIAPGDTVVVLVKEDPRFPQKDVGVVRSIDGDMLSIELKSSGELFVQDRKKVDKPLELLPEDMWDRMARSVVTVEEPTKQAELRKEFRWLLGDFRFSPGGRINAMLGTGQNLTAYNCYVIPIRPDGDGGIDSRQAIIDTLGNMVEIMSRGGGVGINLSALRPRLSYVAGVNGRSSGSVSWGALFSFATGLVEQGGSRRGALMLILEDWHPDLLEFIKAKRDMQAINNANISVAISHAFMEAVREDANWNLEFPDTQDPEYDELWDGSMQRWRKLGKPVKTHRTLKAREIWNTIMESAWMSAEPGVVFLERMNEYSNSWYFEDLISTNPCVTGDSILYTDQGLWRTDDLYLRNSALNVATDSRLGSPPFTPASEVFASGFKPVFRLTTEEGFELRLTADHRLLTDNRGWVQAQDLTPGDGILIHNRGGAFGKSGSLDLGRSLGADTSCSHLPYHVLQGTREMQMGFLQSLFTAHAFVDNESNAVALASDSEQFLQVVQLLLLNFGILGRLRASSQLQISGPSLRRLQEQIGLLDSDKQSELQALAPQTGDERFVATFKALVPDGQEMVYDLTVEQASAFCANGLIVHNCAEQPLPPWGVCNLGHINLSRFAAGPIGEASVDWESLRRAIHAGVRFLDNIIDITPYFFPQNEDVQKGQRRVGMGTMGLGEMLIRMGIRYGSPESLEFIDELYRFIATEAYSASANLSAEKGAFPKFDKEKYLQGGFVKKLPEHVRAHIEEKGMRNVCVLTQAPTGSTGTMIGTSTGIEPYYSWTYWRKGRLGVNEVQERIVAEYFRQHPELESQLDNLPDYFVSAMELAPKEHIQVQAAIQAWTDSSISKTANAPNHYSLEQTKELYEYAYELGCKGVTIYRDGSRNEQVLTKKEETPDEAHKEAPAQAPPADVPAPERERRWPGRPHKLSGATYEWLTPLGKAFITVNEYQGDPIEVFLNIGKAGSDISAMSEALGRLATLFLKHAGMKTADEKVQMLVKHLSDIGGSTSVGFGINRISSVPDALAKTLKVHIEDSQRSQGIQVTIDFGSGMDLCPTCGIAALAREEGCFVCKACGYTKC